MNFTLEQIQEVEEMAGLFFDPEQIGLNLELTDNEQEIFESSVMAKTTNHPLTAAYFKGRLSAQVALRAAIKQSAFNGSNPSQQSMLQFMNESEI